MHPRSTLVVTLLLSGLVASAATGSTPSSAVPFLTQLAADAGVAARIELELARDDDAESTLLAAGAQAAWAAGRFAETISAVRELERRGISVAVAASFTPPLPSAGPTLGSNVLITASVDGEPAIDTALDYDLATGNLLAIAQSADRFLLFRSTDGGATWAQTALWYGFPAATDLSAVAGWGYVAYDLPGNSQLRLRRAFGSDGTWDTTYGYKVVQSYTTVTPGEVVAASNAGTYDNRLYVATLNSDASIHWFWTNATVGTDIYEDSPTTAAAAGGLSTTFVGNAPTGGYFAFLSFRGANGGLFVYRQNSTGWAPGTLVAPAASSTTSIAAFDEMIIVGYNYPWIGVPAAYYRISYDAGGTWYEGILYQGGASFSSPILSTRSGTGIACLVQQEAGTPDFLQFKQRFDYGPGTWSAPQQLNDYDFSTGTTSIDFEYVGLGWGATYIDGSGATWFTLSSAIFYSGFERGDRTEWSTTTP